LSTKESVEWSSAAEKDVTPAAVAAPEEAPKTKKPKATRHNWSKGEGLKRMTDALATWEEEKARPEKDRMSARLLAEKRGNPFSTLQEHLTTNEGKRIKLGQGAGRKSLLNSKSQEVVVDVLLRKDRANEGVGVSGVVDILEDMHPELSRLQIDQSFRRTVRPAHPSRLTGPVAVQPTTTKRTAFTVPQQWRLHKVNNHATFVVPVC